MADPYVALIRTHWPHITELYNQYADQYPIMLVDVQDGSIHAFPYSEFSALLDAPSQQDLAEQYERARENRHMVLFVRDTERKIIQSYSLALED